MNVTKEQALAAVQTLVACASTYGFVGAEAELVRAYIEQADRNMALGAAIERAAGELPEGWLLSIDVEQGCGMVSGLADPDAHWVQVPHSDNGLPGEIHNAIDQAIASKRGGA